MHDRHATVVATATRSLAVTTLFAIAPAFAMAAAAPTCTPSAVIFLHGSGDTGEGLQRGLANSRFTATMKAAGVRLVFPSATPRPYQLAGGNTMSIWFDRTGLPPEAPEHAEFWRTVLGAVNPGAWFLGPGPKCITLALKIIKDRQICGHTTVPPDFW